MNVLLSLIPMAAGLMNLAAPEAMPIPEPAEETAAKIEISFCDADESPDYKIEDDETQKDKPHSKPHFPLPRPQPRRTFNESDKRYKEMKKELDENFAIMFELKKELDAAQSYMSSKWEEYYSLQQAYNEQLQKIVASWVTESLY